MNRTSISFGTYMYQSLYGENGYYTTPNRVGTKGDFYTSVSASKFFGGAIASYILSLLENGELSLPLHIVEIGADKGFLLGDIALFLDALSENVLQQCAFITIEPLIHLAQIQKNHFASLPCELQFDTFTDFAFCPAPHTSTNLFVITNELFDSFPCEVLDKGKMLYIEQDSHLWRGKWQDIDMQESLQHICKSHIQTYSGIVPLWQPFIHTLAHFAKTYTKGYFVSFDYGGFAFQPTLQTNPRFYMAHNTQNLLSFLSQNGDFRTLYKKADITYNVDFTLLDSLLCEVGFTPVFCDTQARVLIEKMHILNLLESFSAQKGFSAYLREIHKVKTLLHTMGGSFQGVCYTMSNLT